MTPYELETLTEHREHSVYDQLERHEAEGLIERVVKPVGRKWWVEEESEGSQPT